MSAKKLKKLRVIKKHKISKYKHVIIGSREIRATPTAGGLVGYSNALLIDNAVPVEINDLDEQITFLNELKFISPIDVGGIEFKPIGVIFRNTGKKCSGKEQQEVK